MREAAEAESDAARSGGESDGSFSRSVARQLHRLMAYKDEYEVARLLLDGGAQVREVFGDGAKATWNLHPPALRSMGLKRKIKFRPWTAPAMKGLRSMKRLRGTPLDPFGRAEVRRTERALIDEYVALVRSLLPTLATDHARGGVDRRARRSDPGLRVGEDAQRRAVPRGGGGSHSRSLTAARRCGRAAVRASTHGRTSSTRLVGLSTTSRKRVNPAASITARRRAGPAWAPRQAPTGCARDAGVQMSVDAE